MAAENANGLWASRPIEVTVRRDDDVLVQRRLNQAFARVGGHPEADVVLPDSAAGACPIYLHATDEGIYCLGLAPETPNGWMRAKNYARLGEYRIYTAFADEGPPPVSARHDPRKKTDESDNWPQIEIRGRHGGKSRRPLPRQLTVVGRSRPSSLRLDDETVCEVHCALYWDGGRLWAIDLMSKNGTLLDGRRIAAAVLPPGHDLLIGNNRLRWRTAPSPSPADSTLVAELRARLEQSERQRAELQQELVQKKEPREVPKAATGAERPALGKRPTNDTIAAGLLGDELVDRLIDFQAKRQGILRRYRLVWIAVAILLL